MAINKAKRPTPSKRGKATGTKRSARTKASAADSLRRPWTPSPRAFTLTLIGVVVTATLMTAGPMPQRSESPDPAMPSVSEAHRDAALSPASQVPAEKAPAQESATPGSVTVTGCLDRKSVV